MKAQLRKIVVSDCDLNVISKVYEKLDGPSASLTIPKTSAIFFHCINVCSTYRRSESEARMPSNTPASKSGFSTNTNERPLAATLKDGIVTLHPGTRDSRLTMPKSQSRSMISSRHSSTPNLRMTPGRHTLSKTPPQMLSAR